MILCKIREGHIVNYWATSKLCYPREIKSFIYSLTDCLEETTTQVMRHSMKKRKRKSYSSLMVVMVLGNLLVSTDLSLLQRFERSFYKSAVRLEVSEGAKSSRSLTQPCVCTRIAQRILPTKKCPFLSLRGGAREFTDHIWARARSCCTYPIRLAPAKSLVM